MINTKVAGFTGVSTGSLFRTLCALMLLSLMLMHTGSHAAPAKSKTLTKDEKKFKVMVHRVAKEVGVDASLLMAVVKVESNFNQNAAHPSGPMGLMQITHTTAKTVSPKISRKELMLPEKNLRVGAIHLKQLLQEFHDPKLALAAYQAGAGKVKEKGHKILRNPQTAAHVDKVMVQYNQYKGQPETARKVSANARTHANAGMNGAHIRNVALTRRN